MNIFVTKINFKTTEQTLRNAFEKHGTVDSVKIIRDRETKRSKGYGFVEMPDDADARQAISALNNSKLDDREIIVSIAREK